jgi:hypothetical protein
MSKLRDIAEKALQGLIPISPEELAEERIKLCEECPHFKALLRQCDLCGCFLDLKTKLLNARCPINKW